MRLPLTPLYPRWSHGFNAFCLTRKLLVEDVTVLSGHDGLHGRSENLPHGAAHSCGTNGPLLSRLRLTIASSTELNDKTPKPKRDAWIELPK